MTYPQRTQRLEKLFIHTSRSSYGPFHTLVHDGRFLLYKSSMATRVFLVQLINMSITLACDLSLKECFEMIGTNRGRWVHLHPLLVCTRLELSQDCTIRAYVGTSRKWLRNVWSIELIVPDDERDSQDMGRQWSARLSGV